MRQYPFFIPTFVPMNTNPPIKFFETKLAEATTLSAKLNRQNMAVAFARTLTFLVFLISLIYWINTRMADTWPALTAGLMLMAFVALLLLHQKNQRNLTFHKSLIKVNGDEIKRLHLQLDDLDSWSEQADPKHPYINDLDIFSRKGLYQLLNRTATGQGKSLLGQQLKGDFPKDTAQVQQAVKELAHLPSELQTFHALGLSAKLDDGAVASVAKFASYEPVVVPLHFRILSWIMPLGFLASSAAWSLGWASGYFPLGFYLTNFVLLGAFHKRSMEFLGTQDRMTPAFALYRSLIHWIMGQKWESEKLNGLANQFGGKHDVMAALRSLELTFSILESRLNLLWSIFVNAPLLIDIHMLHRLGTWQKSHSQMLPVWTRTVAEFDVLNSLAGFAFSQPLYPFPTISDRRYTFQALGLGHPLIDPQIRVSNDFDMDSPQIHLVTGANMSGKSTFLRTLGVNATLAMIGAPVCAKSMTISPAKLFTSMRISDDLGENISSFYAELLRLRQLLDELENGDEPVFILLDEVLRGTNSKDRHLGVRGILDKLIKLPAYGLVTTHDLALGDLEGKSNGKILNFSFNSSIQQEKLHFDYTYTRGQCHSFSASKLMESLGLIG